MLSMQNGDGVTPVSGPKNSVSLMQRLWACQEIPMGLMINGYFPGVPHSIHCFMTIFFPSDGHNWDDTAGQTKKIDLRDTESFSGVVSQWAKRSSEIEKVQLTRTGAVNDWQKEL